MAKEHNDPEVIMHDHYTRITIDLDTGKEIKRERIPCEPYKDRLPEFAQALLPYILPERAPAWKLERIKNEDTA